MANVNEVRAIYDDRFCRMWELFYLAVIRGSAATRLAEAGWEVPEIATVTGHSLKDVDAILDAHCLGRTTKLAVSAVAKPERAAAATGTDGE